MLEDKKCIDFHAHPVTDAFRKAMADLGIDPMEEDGFPLPKWSAEEHLAFMDEAEIDYAILSAPVPHIYNGNAKMARKAARQINEETANIVRGYSDRFGFAGLVPLPDIQRKNILMKIRTMTVSESSGEMSSGLSQQK